jgi:hypothetical protein
MDLKISLLEIKSSNFKYGIQLDNNNLELSPDPIIDQVLLH